MADIGDRAPSLTRPSPPAAQMPVTVVQLNKATVLPLLCADCVRSPHSLRAPELRESSTLRMDELNFAIPEKPHSAWLELAERTLPVTLKILRLRTGDAELFLREMSEWRSMEHPRILLGHCSFDGMRAAVVPDLAGVAMHLRDYPDADRRSLVTQVAEGLEYLHCQRGIVHGDLNARSVFVHFHGKAVIGGFPRSEAASTSLGSFYTARSLSDMGYMAPELLVGEGRMPAQMPQQKTTASDMYAFGMLAYEILSRREPWANATLVEIFRSIVFGTLLPRPEDSTMDDTMWSICTACWAQDPRKRIGIAGVLAALRGVTPHARWRFNDRSPVQHPEPIARYTPAGISERVLRAEIDRSVVDIFVPAQDGITGAFGTVGKGYTRIHGFVSVYAVKFCRKIMPREHEIWTSLSHRNILSLVATIEIRNTTLPGLHERIFVSPYLRLGNLMTYLDLNPLVKRLPLMIGAATGLAYLHDVKAIVHGDIKAENILIAHAGRAVLADFGSSTTVGPSGETTPFEIRQVFTWAYCAPEVLDDRAEDPSAPGVVRSKTRMSDVYAFGVLLYQTYAGGLGRSQGDRIRLMVDMYDGRLPRRPIGRTPIICDDLWSICKGCWANAPVCRPPIAAVLRVLKDLEASPDRQTIENEGS